jgi:GNAT superfamily N-acetyltransferase
MNIAASKMLSQRRCSTPHIEVRLAVLEDCEKVAAFLGYFFARSRWAECLTYDEAKALAYLKQAIPNGFAVYVIALEADELVGLCSYHTYSFFTDPCAVMDETYVVPRLRRTDLGRRLVFLAMHLAKGDGCKCFNFPIASGMREQRSLMNMVQRHFGAEPMGVIFRKVL